ncbi:MAG: tannase/feruloyl esterase family alpha/beta hydrolase [Clostridia bacterium]|nr:tannase/feruloyl esterase family alpha/beta hydrolase [Clostridia bacterium]
MKQEDRTAANKEPSVPAAIARFFDAHPSPKKGDDWPSLTREDDGSLTVRLALSPGARSYIRVEIRLPAAEQYNGVLLGVGIGGLGGYIPTELLCHHAAQGYAAAASDLGTSAGAAAGYQNPDMWDDFGWRANHEMTLAAKQAARIVYGRDPSFCYFLGASTGGQQAMSLAQRFPRDYNGIVAGVPAHSRVALHTYFIWNYHQLHAKDGKPLFSDEEIDAIHNAAVDFMQARGDGEPGDRIVSRPSTDRRVVTRLVDDIARRLPLTDTQREKLLAVYDGPRDPVTGRRIYAGIPAGAEKTAFSFHDMIHGDVDPLRYTFVWLYGPGYDVDDFDYHAGYARMRRVLTPHLDADDPDLSAFDAAGGRLLIYAGAADALVPFHSSHKYLARVRAAIGRRRADRCVRYFLLPGKDHNVGGDGVNRWRAYRAGGRRVPDGDELDVIRRWVEEGQAPDALLGLHVTPEGETTLRRPVPHD